MRHRLVIGLTLLLSAAATGADKPIPQDHARMEQRARERLEWNRQTLQGAYDKVGKKDRRWDESAREALDLAARMFSARVDRGREGNAGLRQSLCRDQELAIRDHAASRRCTPSLPQQTGAE